MMKNRAAFREVNERLRNEAEADQAIFICECESPHCMGTVELSLVQYDLIRANRSLVLRPEHESAEPAQSSWYQTLRKAARKPARAAFG